MTIRTAGLSLAAILAAFLSQSALADPAKPSPSASSVPDPITTGALPTPAPASTGTTSGADGSRTTYFGPQADAKPEAPAAKPTTTATPAPSTPAAAKPTTTATTEAPPAADKPAESAAAAPPSPPPADPVIEALRTKLADKSLTGKDVSSQDLTALADFYASRGAPLWVKDSAITAGGKAIIGELKKADDWGLDASDFVVPPLAEGSSADQQADAEARVALAALKYARFARGGRLDPVSLSNILDMKPPVKESKTALAELTSASDPAAYLRGLNPKHPGFQKLREALLKARGPTQEDDAIDPALLVKLPDAKPLKPGAEDDEVALLRKRLKVAAATTDAERKYDDSLVSAIKDVQQANGMKPNGMKPNGLLNNRIRAILNAEGTPKKADPKRETDRIVANMERWRWLPENLGAFYVMNNIPEFTSEIYKGGKIVLKQKMIVGQPSWPTPVMAADMTIVGMHPSWGMPPGIKMKELLPRVRAAGGNNFFDMLFGGGGGAGSIIRAYKLQAYCNGRLVDPDSVSADNIQNCGFTQPPGADNPLGIVKFRFPNRHDVYMHDTPERGLFSQSMRALSHGCMRVDQPKKTAEVILGEDKGWSAEKVESLFAGSTEVTLDKPFPVYLVYFTARVDVEGHLDRYADIYGHDDRIMSALRGRPVRYVAPEAVDPAGDGNDAKPVASAAEQRAKAKKTASTDATVDSDDNGTSAKPQAKAKKTASTDATLDPDDNAATAKPQAKAKKTTLSDAGSDLLDDAPPAKPKKAKNSKQADRQASRRKSESAGDILSQGLGGFLN